MPGHTPEEKAKNAAARSIQPAPDRQGGSAAVQDDSGFNTRLKGWREFLGRPEVRAGLLQFSAQILQVNPGGLGPALGTSLAAGLGAAGRVGKLEREQGQEREDRAGATRQQQIENQFEGRRVTEIEKRTAILGRPKVGRGGKGEKELTRQKVWEGFFQGNPELGEEILDPGTLGRLGRSAAAAEADIDGDFMAACQAVGNTARSCAETYLDPQLRRDMKFTTGLSSVGDAPSGGEDKSGASKLTPGARTPSAVRGAGESPEDFTVRQQEQKATETTRVETLGTQDEVQRLETDTANRQGQVGDFVKTEIASGRRNEEEISELLIQRGFTDQVSLDFLLDTYPGLWEIVTRKLTNG